MNADLQDNFLRNYNAVLPYFPGLPDVLARQHTEGKRSELVISESGIPNIHYNGEAIYGESPLAEIQQQLHTFAQKPARFRVDPQFAPPGNIDLHTQTLIRLFNQSPLNNRANPAEDGFQFNGKDIPVLLVLGIGLGYHLEVLIEQYNIRRIIIADFDPQLLVTSLFTADWKKIIDYFEQPGRRLEFVIHPIPETLGFLTLQSVGMASRVLFCNALVFTHYEHDRLVKARAWLAENGMGGLHGWGYFDDELETVIQTLMNLKKNIPAYRGHVALPRPAVAIIAAAGPSLNEEALEAIKRWQDQAVIFSCGRALQVLCKAGIEPDIHIEVERDKNTVEHLQLQIKNCGRLQMDSLLLLPTRMHPQIMDLSSQPLIYCKAQDAGGSLLPIDYPRVEHANPNVANGGAAMAAYLGFSDIIFFGVDLGYYTPEKHHAEGSIYYENGGRFERSHQFGDMEMAAVGGGSITSEQIFHWSRMRLEHLIMQSPHAKFVNASQGAHIHGTEVIKPQDLQIGNAPTQKSVVLAALKANFESWASPEEIVAETIRNLEQGMDEIVEYLDQHFSKPAANRGDIMDRVLGLDDLLQTSRLADSAASWLFGGSLAHYTMILWTHASYTGDERKAVDFANTALRIIRTFARNARAMTKEKIEIHPKLRAMDAALDETGGIEQVANHIEQLYEQYPDQFGLAAYHGEWLYDKKRYADAGRLLHVDKAKNRLSPESAYYLAIAKAQEEQIDEAVDLMGWAYRKNPGLRDGFVNIARAENSKHKWKSAFRIAKMDEQLKRVGINGYALLARLYAQFNNLTYAVNLIDILYSQKPNVRGQLSDLGWIEILNGNWDSAYQMLHYEKNYGRWIPSHAVFLAMCMVFQGYWDSVLMYIQEAYASSSSVEGLYTKLGWFCYLFKRDVQLFEDLVAMDVSLNRKGQDAQLYAVLLSVAKGLKVTENDIGASLSQENNAFASVGWELIRQGNFGVGFELMNYGYNSNKLLASMLPAYAVACGLTGQEKRALELIELSFCGYDEAEKRSVGDLWQPDARLTKFELYECVIKNNFWFLSKASG